jgi:hypothetical protein
MANVTMKCADCGSTKSVEQRDSVLGIRCSRCNNFMDAVKPWEESLHKTVNLRRVAIFQKLVLFCFLVKLIMILGSVLHLWPEQVNAVAFGISLTAGVMTTLFVFILVFHLYDPVSAILHGMLMSSICIDGALVLLHLLFNVFSNNIAVVVGGAIAVACIGIALINLFVVSGGATAALRRNGYKVGIFGARLSQFR